MSAGHVPAEHGVADAHAPGVASRAIVSRLRVLNIVYDERFGGPQSRILQVAGALRRHDIETVVVTRRGDPRFPALLEEAQIAHHEVALSRARRSLNPVRHGAFVAAFWPNVMLLRRLIRKHRIDLVHNNGAMHWQGAVAARREGVALVWHLNDVRLPGLLRPTVPRLVANLADSIAVASGAVAEYYFRRPGETDAKIHVIYPPVDLARFNPAVEGDSIRAELGISADAPVIATVANLCPGKGIEHLLAAAARIGKALPQARFLIAGAPLGNRDAYRRGLFRMTAELGLQEAVRFVGLRRDIERIFAAADVYVHPSDHEAAPMAVMEASASGLPVVASDVGGTREIVEHGATGLLCAARRPEQLARSVLELVSSPPRAAWLGANGVRRMRERFSLDSCAERHREIYWAAIARAGARAPALAGV